MVQNPYKCLWFLESIPQNHTNSYFFSYNFCDVHKISQHSDFLLGFFQIVNEWPDFTAATKMQHVFKSLYAFWLLCQEVETFVWILKHVHTLITVQRKRINLGQMIHHNMIFYLVVSNYQQVKHTVFEIFPSSLDNLKMAYIPWLQGCSSLFQFFVFCWTNLLISARQIKKESNVTSKHTRPWQVVMIKFTYKIIYLSLDLKTVNVTEQNVLMLSWE